VKWLIDLLKALFGGKGTKTSLPIPAETEPPEVDSVETLSGIADKVEPARKPEEGDLEGDGAEDYVEDYFAQPERKATASSVTVSLVLKLGDQGPKVKEFQGWLEKLGYELTRFGADGGFGDETLQETCDFQDDDRAKEGTLKNEEHAIKLGGVGPRTYEAIKAAATALPVVAPPPIIVKEPDADPSDTTPDNFYRVYEGSKGVKSKGLRKNGWKSITGITLHQTACKLGDKPTRYKKVSAHIGIPGDGKIVQMNPLEQIVYHGNSFNGSRGPGDVGIEIDGHFAGIEGNIKTYWRPASQPDRQPLTVTEAQVKATLDAIKWIIDEVKRNGGEVKYIHAHRQSSMSRVSDPGSKIWQKIALVAKERWGLLDGGPDFKAGGKRIPQQWDPTYTADYKKG